MSQRTLRIPVPLKHTSDEQTDVALQEKAREHVDRHPGLRYLADVLRALHASAVPLRNAKAFYSAFAPREVMDALAQRPDLRVKVVKAITGGAPTLLRRLPSDALASQIDLLMIEDLPEAERSVRAEGDRALSVHDLYLKYLDPLDIATYLPTQAIWTYESNDDWWKWEPGAGARLLMATELRSIRRHAILTDSEFLDLLGEETLEEHLSVAVRAGLRKAARRAGAAGRPFTDTDLFAGVGGGSTRDLIDEMVDTVPMPLLRGVVVQAGRLLCLAERDDSEEPTNVTAGTITRDAAAPTPIGVRIGPKSTPAVAAAPAPASGKHRVPTQPSTVPLTPRPIPAPPPAKGARPPAAPIPTGDAGPPGPDDDDLALLEELSGRVL